MSISKQDAMFYARQLNKVDYAIWNAIFACEEFILGSENSEGTIPYLVKQEDRESLKMIMERYEKIRNIMSFAEPNINGFNFDKYEEFCSKLEYLTNE